MMLPWRSLATAASVAAAAAAAAVVGSRLDCNPTVFFHDIITTSFQKQAYYSDKRIWIIGASSGIGREMALQLAGGGGGYYSSSSSASSSSSSSSSSCIRVTPPPPPPRIVILSGRNVKQLETVAQQCREIQEQNLAKTAATTARTTFCVVPLDVTNHERIKYVVQRQVPAILQQQTALLDMGDNSGINNDNNGETVDNNQQQRPSSSSSSSSSAGCLLDIIVLNSGAGHLSPALQTSPQVIEKVMQTNAIWPMIFMPLLLNSATTSEKSSSSTTMIAAASTDTTSTTTSAASPHFIIMSSIAADLRAVPLSAAYAASKAALTAYFCSLSAERPDLAMDMCLPGPVDTDFHCHHIIANANANDDTTITRDYSNTSTIVLDADKKESSSSSSSSPLKMSVQRCAQIVLSAASMRQRQTRRQGHRRQLCSSSLSSYRHIWIAKQPIIFILYLHQWMPSLLLNKLFARMGPTRIAMWEAGLDLYNPQSWVVAVQQQHQQQQDNSNNKRKGNKINDNNSNGHE